MKIRELEQNGTVCSSDFCGLFCTLDIYDSRACRLHSSRHNLYARIVDEEIKYFEH